MRLGFVLPVLFGWLVYRLLRRIGITTDRRETFLHAAVITGVFLVASTEVLSAFHALTSIAVALVWTAGDIMFVWLRCRAKALPAQAEQTLGFPRDPLARLLWPLTGLLVLLVGITSALAVPNSWDALTYHLPRAAHWLQNRSIAIFPTSCLYQNQHGPFAEWAVLHLWLLQGNDHATNLISFAAYVVSIVGACLLTQHCGGSERASALAAFFVATLPMAILQASSVQTDLVVGALLLCVACACVSLTQKPIGATSLFFGASLGLALLTKATAYLFAFPFCLWIIIALVRRGWREALPYLVAIALVAGTLNAGYWIRNFESSGTLLGASADSGPGFRYENELHTPAAILSNLVRNAALQTPQFPAAQAVSNKLVRASHRSLGLDPADPRTTGYAPYFYLPGSPLDDEIANPLHFLVISAGLVLLLIARRRDDSFSAVLAACVLFGAFLFCFVLKWQPFHSRLQLPLFLLGLPAATIGLETLRWRYLAPALVALMLVGAVPLAVASYAHPWFGARTIFHRSRQDERFLIPNDQSGYEQALATLHAARVGTLGIIGPIDNTGWEYPLFDPDHMNFGFPWRVEQINVHNFYSPLESTAAPDAVVSLVPKAPDSVIVHGQLYHRVQATPALSLYLK